MGFCKGMKYSYLPLSRFDREGCITIKHKSWTPKPKPQLIVQRVDHPVKRVVNQKQGAWFAEREVVAEGRHQTLLGRVPLCSYLEESRLSSRLKPGKPRFTWCMDREAFWPLIGLAAGRRNSARPHTEGGWRRISDRTLERVCCTFFDRLLCPWTSLETRVDEMCW